MTIRILLIDDHTLFRSGMKLLLNRQADFEVVAEAADGIEGLKRARELRPDVILLDLNMPGLSGLEALQILTQDLPDCAVVILTVSEEGEELAQALRSGARGYLVKNIDAEALVAGIRQAAAGEPAIAPAMTRKLAKLGLTAVGSSAVDFAQFIAAEEARWADVVKANHISVN